MLGWIPSKVSVLSWLPWHTGQWCDRGEKQGHTLAMFLCNTSMLQWGDPAQGFAETWVAPRNSTAANTAPCPVWTRLFSSQSTLRANTLERFSLGLWNQGCLWAALPHISTPRPGPWALLSAAMAVLLLHHSNQSNWQRRQAKPPETCWQIPVRLQICLNLQTNCFCYWIMLLKAAVWKCNGLENGGQ